LLMDVCFVLLGVFVMQSVCCYAECLLLCRVFVCCLCWMVSQVWALGLLFQVVNLHAWINWN